MQVLFIGNSYTFFNDMPEMFANLVQQGGYEVNVVSAAYGGWTLADHAASSETAALIADKAWDYVVLQEQSIISSVEERRNTEMVPAARILVDQIKAVNSQPLFFMTWGRRNGLLEYGFEDFTAMQEQLKSGYENVARDMESAVSPVGLAWQRALMEVADMPLWDIDGSHPSVEGSYLTACVFYAVIVEESPESLTYYSGLSAEQARTLQRITAEVVLDHE